MNMSSIKRLMVALCTISFLYSEWDLTECGPPPMMPNYLCPDGITLAGPGDCIENENGDCYWEIIECPSETITGYLRTIEISACQDACSQYYIESEVDGSFGLIPIIPQSTKTIKNCPEAVR